MRRDEIKKLLKEMDEELQRINIKGEIILYGGAVMCLAYDARPSTKDVDAIFKPTGEIRRVAQKVASSNNLPEGWLNDAVKGFVVPHPQRVLFDYPNLKVYVPEPEYLLAMKTLAARVDTSDKKDVLFLIQHLGLKSPKDIFTIVEKYYPRNRIKPATQFFIEELFENDYPENS